MRIRLICLYALLIVATVSAGAQELIAKITINHN